MFLETRIWKWLYQMNVAPKFHQPKLALCFRMLCYPDDFICSHQRPSHYFKQLFYFFTYLRISSQLRDCSNLAINSKFPMSFQRR